ncbi:MAG: hypothetical protein R3242_01475 [Akkermansiaceae bacterium]|nr:hypothetical protein [Akkermansiaceae bacterium]
MKICALALFVLFLANCAGPRDALTVRQFQLRDQETEGGEMPSVRMEKLRRLHGAVSMEERRQRLGQYYTLIWEDQEGVGTGPVEVIFEYRQGGSASEIKRMSELYPPEVGSGVVEFAVIGDNYFDNGKVLAWRASVSRGGEEIASEKSYLWE